MPTLKRVLVVEDDTTVYPLIRAMILKLNPQTEIEYADSAEKSAELLLGPNPKKYDVILSDLNLAGQKNGVDLVKEVYFKTARTPFVIATVDEEFVTNLPYLRKPFKYEEFAERMGPFLRDSKTPARSNGMLIAAAVIVAAAAAFFLLRR